MAGPTWDSTFRTALYSRNLEGLQVAVVLGPTYSPSIGGPAAGEDITFRNFGTDTATQFRCLGNSIRDSGGSLDPVTWTTTAGQLSFEVVSEAAVRAALDAGVHRGTLVEVRVTLRDDSPATDYYRVWIGRLQNIESTAVLGSRTAWRFTCYGAQSLLQARRIQTGTTAGTGAALLGASKLFHDAGGEETYITPLSYTVGDSNLNVNSTTGFARETGGSGCILLNDGTNSFYLTYTGKTGTTFTGLSSTGMFGTTAANMAAGGTSIVRHIPYLTGHPLDIVRRVLQSTGGGTNGAWDDYPGAWGLGIPADLVDNTDIATWKSNVVDSSVVYHLLITSAQENAWSWLSGWLSRVGIAIVPFEGRLSVRCAQDVSDASPERASFGFADGATMKATWQLADNRNAYEYVTVRADAAQSPNWSPLSSSVSSLLYTTPGGGYVQVPLWDVSYGETGETDRETDVETRRWHWTCGIAERVEADVSHLGPASLCPGDLTTMTTALCFGVPESASSTATYSAEDVLVVDGPALDWLVAQRVTVAVLRYRDETPPEE